MSRFHAITVPLAHLKQAMGRISMKFRRNGTSQTGSGRLVKALHTVQTYSCPREAKLDADEFSRLHVPSVCRAWIMAIFLCVVAGFLARHLYRLQILRHEELAAKATQVHLTSQSPDGLRGRIFDLNGIRLADNLTTMSVFAEPKRMEEEDREYVLEQSVRLLNVKRPLIENRFRRVFSKDHCACMILPLAPRTALEIAGRSLPGVSIESGKKETFGEAPTGQYFYKLALAHAKFNERKEDILNELSKLTDIPAKELEDCITQTLNRPREIVVARNVDMDNAMEFKRLMEQRKVKGLRFTHSSQRVYPAERQLANLIGHLGHVSSNPLPPATAAKRKIPERLCGISGIEKVFDTMMQPQLGKVTYSHNASGVLLPQSDLQFIPPTNGADIYLTIQMPIQRIMETEMNALMEQVNPQRAYAAMMNPATGEIMALYQFPSFDPAAPSNLCEGTEFIRGKDSAEPHAFTLPYDPGSIMKGISIASAIDYGVCDLDTIYFCENGHWLHGGKVLRESHGAKYADMNIIEILKKSSNIGSAKIGLDLGKEALYASLRSFGFGQQVKLGFIPDEVEAVTELNGGHPLYFNNETRGRLRALESWDPVTETRIPIGQGISCSLFQMLQAYGALANHGYMMQPYLVDRIVTQEKTYYSKPFVKGQPIQPETAKKIVTALKAVTGPGGTGRKAAVEGYEVAGKTGTAQKWISPKLDKETLAAIAAAKAANPKRRVPVPKGYYSTREHYSSFVGIVPADNPAFVMLITVDDAQGMTSGGAVCGPTFSRIAEQTLRLLQIEPSTQEQDKTGNNTATAHAFP